MMKLARKTHRGFTLIEVLITVLILSIGLLGLAGLQLSSLKNSHSAYLRSQATYLAYDIMDRMRANLPSAIAGSYNIAMTDPAPTATGTIAKNDMKEWMESVCNTLPAGDASVVRNGNFFTITIQWDDSRVGAATAEQQYVLTSQL